MQKCKHCGEWLDASKRPAALSPTPAGQRPDYSQAKPYLVNTQWQKHPYYRSIWALNETDARARTQLRDGETIHNVALRFSPGRFTCPLCRSPYTRCERDIGCVVAVMIFISLGLGAIMIPFLPFKCECEACKNRWKT